MGADGNSGLPPDTNAHHSPHRRGDLKTSSFFDYTGPGRISIARFPPRATPPGFRVYRTLAPGPWFNSVERPEYERLYFAQLAALSPHKVAADLTALAAGAEPVLLCWETKRDIFDRKTAWCHRRMFAAWLERELGVAVPEL